MLKKKELREFCLFEFLELSTQNEIVTNDVLAL